MLHNQTRKLSIAHHALQIEADAEFQIRNSAVDESRDHKMDQGHERGRGRLKRRDLLNLAHELPVAGFEHRLIKRLFARIMLIKEGFRNAGFLRQFAGRRAFQAFVRKDLAYSGQDPLLPFFA